MPTRPEPEAIEDHTAGMASDHDLAARLQEARALTERPHERSRSFREACEALLLLFLRRRAAAAQNATPV